MRTGRGRQRRITWPKVSARSSRNNTTLEGKFVLSHPEDLQVVDSGVHPGYLWHLPCVKEEKVYTGALSLQSFGTKAARPTRFITHLKFTEGWLVQGEAKFDVLCKYLGLLETLSDVQLTSAKEKWGPPRPGGLREGRSPRSSGSLANGEPTERVYIGGGGDGVPRSRWENRFKVIAEVNNEKAAALHMGWFARENLVQHIGELRGKVLLCHCHPFEVCHGDFLAEDVRLAHELTESAIVMFAQDILNTIPANCPQTHRQQLGHTRQG